MATDSDGANGGFRPPGWLIYGPLFATMIALSIGRLAEGFAQSEARGFEMIRMGVIVIVATVVVFGAVFSPVPIIALMRDRTLKGQEPARNVWIAFLPDIQTRRAFTRAATRPLPAYWSGTLAMVVSDHAVELWGGGSSPFEIGRIPLETVVSARRDVRHGRMGNVPVIVIETTSPFGTLVFDLRRSDRFALSSVVPRQLDVLVAALNERARASID